MTLQNSRDLWIKLHTTNLLVEEGNMPFQLTDYSAYDFPSRHIGPSPQEMADMLKTIGYNTLDELIDDTVPASIRQTENLDWGPAMSERDALFYIREVANKNSVLTSLIGQGYYGTTTPPVILRNILENPAWYTAYTPYQPGNFSRPIRSVT